MFAPVEQEKHEIFVLVMALNISSKSKSTHGANYFNNGSPTDYCDKPVMKPSLVITFARALFKPEVVWGCFLSSSLRRHFGIMFRKGIILLCRYSLSAQMILKWGYLHVNALKHSLYFSYVDSAVTWSHLCKILGFGLSSAGGCCWISGC